MSWLVDGLALALVAGIAWWFWIQPRMARPAPATTARGVVDILVADGAYQPAEVGVPAGRDTVLRFLRRDASPCAAMVLIDELGISAELPVGRPVDVVVNPPRAGRYAFTCQMRMYRGTLVATEDAGHGA
jgi:plastocyanin domain-containing protein